MNADITHVPVVVPARAPLIPRIPPDLSLAPDKRNWQASWPRQDYLDLVAVRAAVPSARHHLREILREWRLHDVAYEAEQVTAELVANAVNATRLVSCVPKTPPVRLWLLGAADRLVVAVWDATAGIPTPRAPMNNEESGRGLILVDDFSAWGYYLAPEHIGGKVVWARLPKGEREAHHHDRTALQLKREDT